MLLALLLGANLTQAQTLEQRVLRKIAELDSVITIAKKEGVDTQKEKMAIRVAEMALKFAKADEIPANLAKNKECYAMHIDFKNNPQKAAEALPDFERESAIVVLNNAIATLQSVRKGEIYRRTVPHIDYTKITVEGASLMQDGRPVFDADYVWRPDLPEINEYFGGADSEGLRLNHIQNSSGTPNSWAVNNLKNRTDPRIGSIWIDNNIPSWAQSKWPDINVGGRHFGKFDIDHNGSREMFRFMFDAFVPVIEDKRVTEMGYDLHNEPSFFTKANSWNNTDDNGVCVSDSTRERFKVWLKLKHGDIAVLNALWGTSFSGFDKVTVTLPMAGAKQGTPLWYDWMTFNNYRVTDWFTFLKNQIRKHDPDAKVRIKLMPWLWAENAKDHGMDFEALTELCDIIGPDMGARYYTRWGDNSMYKNYSVDYRCALMTMDFFKSIQPDQIIHDSESHILMDTEGFLPNDLNLDYVRSMYWLAAQHGLNTTNTWVWARNEDGQISRNASEGYIVDITHQPKALYELTETFMDLNCFANEITAMQKKEKPIRIYYSKTSGINSGTYMDEVFKTYESLLFNGIPIGFATENILKHRNGWEVVLIRNTPYATQGEYQAVQEYLNNGGKVIMDGLSFKKNEYGQALDALNEGTGSLILTSGLSDMKTKALNLVKEAGLEPVIQLTETNSIGTPGCIWRSIKNDEGNPIVSVTNLGKSNATIVINQNDGKPFDLYDLFTYKQLNDTLTVKPFQTVFCVVQNENTESMDSISVDTVSARIKPDIAVSVSVNYQTGSPRSLSLMLEDTLTHNTYGIQTYVVYGHGTKKISFIPKNNPPESSNFRWVITLSQRDKLETIVNEQKYTYPVEVSSKVYAHSIRINSASLLLDSAETVPLTVTFFPEETNYTYIQWHSSDTSIVKVNEKGRLSAIAKGMAFVYATDTISEQTDSCKIEVRAKSELPDPWKMTVLGTPTQEVGAVFQNDTFIISGTGEDVWFSSDEFTYVFQTITGDAIISAKIHPFNFTDAWAKVGLMVRNEISQGSMHGTAFLTPSNGFNFQYRAVNDQNMLQAWKTQNETAPIWIKLIKRGPQCYAFYSPDGENWTGGNVLKLELNDTYNIGLFVCSHNNNALCTAKFSDVWVRPVTKAERIDIGFTDTTMYVGEQLALRAMLYPENTTFKEVLWESGNPEVATVNSQGAVKGVSPGSTFIYAIAEDGKIKDSCAIEVQKVPVQSINFLIKDTTIYAGDDGVILTYVITPNNATYKRVVWRSSDVRIATVDATGHVVGHELGTAVIKVSATDNAAIADSCVVRVEKKLSTQTIEKEEVKIFPNPFEDKFVINNSGGNHVEWLAIYDIRGNAVYAKAKPGTSNYLEIDLSSLHLPSGVYCVYLMFDEGSSTFKVTKQN